MLFILSRLHVIEKIQPKVKAREKKKAERYKPVYQSLFSATPAESADAPKQLSEGDSESDGIEDENKETEDNG